MHRPLPPYAVRTAAVVAVVAIVVGVLILARNGAQPSPSPSASAVLSQSPTGSPSPSAYPLPSGTPSSTGPVSTAVLPGSEPRAVSFVDDKTGFAVAGMFEKRGGSILATTDGGNTWEVRASLDIFPAGGLTQLKFVDANNGWLLTSVLLPGMTAGCAPPPTAPNECRTVIFKTSDGGRTWREQLSVEQPPRLGPGLRALTAVDAHHAWAVRLADTTHSTAAGSYDNRGLVATTDGEHWSDIATLPALSEDLDFVDARNGWATTHTSDSNGQPTITSTILMTTDGGHSWTPQLSLTQRRLSQFQVDFLDSQNGWALLAGSQGDECGQTIVGPIMCSSYALYRTSDGGRSWHKLQDNKPPTAWWSPKNNTSILGAPLFVSIEIGWIPIVYDGTSFGGLLLTRDGGRTWARVNINDASYMRDFSVKGSFAWLVGERSDEKLFVARLDPSANLTYVLVISRAQ